MTTVNSVSLIVDPKEGSVVVAEDMALLHYSTEGWALIAIIQEESVRIDHVKVEGSYNTVDKQVPCTKTKYVLRQSKDETMRKLAWDLDSASSKNRKLEMEVETLTKELAKGDKRIQEATGALEKEICFLRTENEIYRNEASTTEHQVRDLQKKLDAEELKASSAIEQLRKLGGIVDDSGMPKVQEKMVRESMRKTTGEA
jgi:hypothetical protein